MVLNLLCVTVKIQCEDTFLFLVVYSAPAPFYESYLQNLIVFYCVKCFHPIVFKIWLPIFIRSNMTFLNHSDLLNCPTNLCNLLTCAKTSGLTSQLGRSLSFVNSSMLYFPTYKGGIVMLLSYPIFLSQPFRGQTLLVRHHLLLQISVWPCS